MNKKIKFALIGCGSITKKHLKSLERLDDAKLTAVCDVDANAAQKIANAYGIPFYTDYHEMAQKEDFDIFSVLTPSGTHSQVVLDLIEYNKNFLIEKPLALQIADADRIIRVCDERGLKIYVVQQNRYNRPIIKLKEAIEKGRFGKMVLGTIRVRWCRRQEYYDIKQWRGTWSQDGGVLTNQASHFIDMLSWLLGDVQDVMALTETRLANIEAEDTGVASIRFSSGALGVIEATTATRPSDIEGSISILGEKGSVEVGGFYMNQLKLWQFEEHEEEDDEIFEKWGTNPDIWAWNHTEYLKDVIKSQKHNIRGMVDGFDGRKSLELINAIYESAETGKMVSLFFKPKYCRLGVVD